MQVLVRLAPEITTKAPKTRARFIRTLVKNLKAAFSAHGIPLKVERAHSRLFLRFDAPQGIEVASRVFGVHSLSPCLVESLGEAVGDEALAYVTRRAVELMSKRIEGKTFAVRAKGRDPRIGLSSQAMNESIGGQLSKISKVNLSNPEVRVELEVRDGQVAFFTDRIDAVGGIPIGEGGRAVVLLSAGFDSAVAAFFMMRRGIRVEFVSCRLGGDEHEKAVLAVARRLSDRWMSGLPTRLWSVPLEDAVEQLRVVVMERYRQLVLKRLMYQVGEAVAFRTRADALVTGESLGQVSSQTLSNLRSLEYRCQLPVLRPLLTTGKEEIIAWAKRVGTEHLSSGVPEYCGLGTRPATSSTSRIVAEWEDKMEGFDARERVNSANVTELPSGDDNEASKSSKAARGVTSISEGSVVLDLRSESARRGQTIEGAQQVDPLEILQQPAQLSTTSDYVVVCDSGPRSVWFASELVKLGFTAVYLEA